MTSGEFASNGLSRGRAKYKSLITTSKGEAMAKTITKLDPITPGEILWEEFLVPMNISRYRLAKDIGVPAQRIGDIVMGKRSITADTDLRLCKYFGLSEGYWMRAQAACDLEIAKSAIEAELEKIIPISS
jgi:addiction module HigA family antidote